MSVPSNLRPAAAALLVALVTTACGASTAGSDGVRDDIPDDRGQVEEPRSYPPTDIPVREVPPDDAG